MLAESVVTSNVLMMSGLFSPKTGFPLLKRMYPLSLLSVGKVRDCPENSVVRVEAVLHPVLCFSLGSSSTAAWAGASGWGALASGERVQPHLPGPDIGDHLVPEQFHLMALILLIFCRCVT